MHSTAQQSDTKCSSTWWTLVVEHQPHAEDLSVKKIKENEDFALVRGKKELNCNTEKKSLIKKHKKGNIFVTTDNTRGIETHIKG